MYISTSQKCSYRGKSESLIASMMSGLDSSKVDSMREYQTIKEKKHRSTEYILNPQLKSGDRRGRGRRRDNSMKNSSFTAHGREVRRSSDK